jgi:hypothetical protein
MGISDQFKDKAEQLQRRAKEMSEKNQSGKKKKKPDEHGSDVTDRAKKAMRDRQQRDR